MTLEERVANLEQLLLNATARIAELERETGTIDDIARHRELKQLKAKYKAQGLSSRKAADEAWLDQNRRPYR